MKKEEYLHKALLLVSNPYTKAQVQRELEDHIEDEISFYTDAGHEIKTPLTSIATSADVLAVRARGDGSGTGPPAPQLARACAGLFRLGGVRGTVCAVWV